MDYKFNNSIIEQMWKDRYQKNGETTEENLKRVAKFVADNSQCEEDILHIMEKGYFFFGGRTMSNAGIGTNLTVNNCFVAPQIQDSMQDIFEKVKLGAVTHQKGGGIGYDFSLLRPKNTPTSNDAIASGALSFMDVFNAQTATILQGNRRGANMGIMNIYDMDIEEFVTAKSKDPNRLNHFNLSVMVDDDFMKAVQNNEDIYLHFPVYDEKSHIIKDSNKWTQSKKISANYLWDLIMTNAYNNGEPGVFFYDNANNDNNLKYIETICCSNPCFTKDMKLLTTEGYKTFEELNGRNDVGVISYNGDISLNNKVWCSGTKDILNIKFTTGEIIKCTPNHIFMLNDGTECEAKDLKSKRIMPHILNNNIDYNERYIKYGFIQGDGHTSRLKSKYHQGIEVCIGKNDEDIYELFKNEKYTKISKGIYLDGYKDDLINLEFSSEPLPNRKLPKTFNNWTYINKLSFLKGLFSANGCVVKHHRIQFKGTCYSLITDLQSILNDLGINSIITTNKAKKIVFDNGEYLCKESYDLAINQYESIVKFNELIGFVHTYKNNKLISLIKEKSPYIVSVHSDGKEKVYDFTENINHWGVVNGFVAHNCFEYLAGTTYGINPITKEVIDSSQYGGACNLGSIMLQNYILNPFTNNATFDIKTLDNTIDTIVRCLDNIIDVNHFPDDIYKNYQQSFRTIGLGVTGLADALAMLGYKYDTLDCRNFVDWLMNTIAKKTYRASIKLAKEKGSFPFLDKDKFIQSGYLTKHAKNDAEWKEIIKDIHKYGIRNGKMLSVAPCGTMSLVWGNNCSSGIEPIFSLDYKRKVRIGGQSEEDEKIIHMTDYAYDLAKKTPQTIDFNNFPTALEMSVDDHIDMLGVIAKHIDMSVSKTINVPEEYSFEETKGIYEKCWRLGIKGCTIFRPNRIRQGILLTNNEKEDKKNSDESIPLNELQRGDVICVSDDLLSCKRTVVNGCGKFYIHVDFDEITGEPMETFIDIGSGGGCERNLQFISRLISLLLRSGTPIEAIIDQAKSIKPCTAYVSRTNSKKDTSKGSSCPSAIGFALEELNNKIHERCFADDNEEPSEHIVEHNKSNQGTECPNCKEITLINIGGCQTCTACGWSKCD